MVSQGSVRGQSGVAKTFEIFRNPKCLIDNAFSSDSKTDYLMSQANRVLSANILSGEVGFGFGLKHHKMDKISIFLRCLNFFPLMFESRQR